MVLSLSHFPFLILCEGLIPLLEYPWLHVYPEFLRDLLSSIPTSFEGLDRVSQALQLVHPQLDEPRHLADSARGSALGELPLQGGRLPLGGQGRGVVLCQVQQVEDHQVEEQAAQVEAPVEEPPEEARPRLQEQVYQEIVSDVRREPGEGAVEVPKNSRKREAVVALIKHYLQSSLIEGRVEIWGEVMISQGGEPLGDELEACLHALVVVNTTK